MATEDNKEFKELMNKADSGELTQASLQQKLNDYSKALEEEMKVANEKQPDDIELHIKDFFKRNSHSMAAQVVWLANNAESESVQLSACKYGLQLAFEQSKEEGDPIAGLLRELTSKAKQKAATEPAPIGNDG